jgi:hypothetical protein
VKRRTSARAAPRARNSDFVRVITAEAVLIEGIFYGGRDFEAELRDRT